MVSKWRITALLSLCLVGTLACGFSSWIYSESISASTGEITVGFGDIKSSASIVYQSCSTFTYGKSGILHQDENGIEYFDYNFEIKSVWCVDTSIVSDAYYVMSQSGIKAYNGSIFNFFSIADSSFTAKFGLVDDEKNSSDISVIKNDSVTEANKAVEYELSLSASSKGKGYLFLTYFGNLYDSLNGNSFEDCVYRSTSSGKNFSIDFSLKNEKTYGGTK